MTDINEVKPETREEVELAAHDEYALLYEWIEELLIRFDARGKLFSRFEISKIEEREGGLHLRAKIWGEAFDPEKHPQRLGVKAITYHRMEIEKEPGNITLKFLLDV
jgi:SHS2 domain-containing protein